MSTPGEPRDPRRPSVEPGFLDSGDDDYDENAPEFLVPGDDDKWAAFAPTETPPAGFVAPPSEALPTPPIRSQSAPASLSSPAERGFMAKA